MNKIMTTHRRTNYLIIAVILLALAIGLTGVLISVNAEKAPTGEHCELLTDADTCYLLVQPGRSITMEQYGDAWVFSLSPEPDKGE